MTDKVELFEFLYDKCREDRDLLANILDEYVDSLSDNKLIELEDFLVNNFGDDWNEHNNCNLFDSSYNTWRTFILFKGYANKAKDTQRD